MASKISKTLLILILITVLIVASVAAFYAGFRYVRAQNENFRYMDSLAEASGGNLVNEDTPGAIEIFIPRSSNMDDITNLLAAEGFIDNKLIFKVMSKFNGFDGNYQAGTHYLLADMTYDEIMFALTRQPKPLRITFLEGDTYLQMKERMLDAGLNIDVDRLDDLVRHPNAFLDYNFVRQIEAKADREWTLQGYLWPDTYLFDPNLDEESIIRMFLNNTQQKLNQGGYATRAASMGMTLDQVMTLASVVQKEGNIEEMSMIGRVFLNRYGMGMPLEACSTINYLRGEEGLEPIPWALYSDLVKYANNPFNTYSFQGLPPGPINNPGTLSVEGILWPANEENWQGANEYLYFCATGEGDNVFARTLAEHEANVEYYSSRWYEEAGLETPQ